MTELTEHHKYYLRDEGQNNKRQYSLSIVERNKRKMFDVPYNESFSTLNCNIF